MKISPVWIGIVWILLVAGAAIACFMYFASELLKQDTTVLPWLLLPAAGVIFAIAYVLALPGVLMLFPAKPKRSRPTPPQYGGQTLGQLMAAKKVGTVADKQGSGSGPGGA
jgi:hypothetical protein